jgi:3-hydroxybutyryl-CoA dehydrogenase
MITEIKTVGIIGAGTMGQGIAQVCASAGYNVKIHDVRSDLVAAGIGKISIALQTLVEKQKLAREEMIKTLDRIAAAEKMDDLDCEIVIEAAAENIDIKKQIFLQLEKALKPSVVLTTNTSSIPITQIAGALNVPARFAGLHFFNPAPVMKLVEVIKGASTTEETVLSLERFCTSLGKQTVRAYDSPGFIVNRVARHYYVESLKLLEGNVASFSEIDKLMRASGFKMGPFELMDLIGVDVNLAVTSSMYSSFHQEPKFRPNRIQQQKVDAGQVGRKSGKGFYDYNK